VKPIGRLRVQNEFIQTSRENIYRRKVISVRKKTGKGRENIPAKVGKVKRRNRKTQQQEKSRREKGGKKIWRKSGAGEKSILPPREGRSWRETCH